MTKQIQPPEKISLYRWMARVDAILYELTSGKDSRDLKTLKYVDLFDSGCTPAQAARIALQNDARTD